MPLLCCSCSEECSSLGKHPAGCRKKTVSLAQLWTFEENLHVSPPLLRKYLDLVRQEEQQVSQYFLTRALLSVCGQRGCRVIWTQWKSFAASGWCLCLFFRTNWRAIYWCLFYQDDLLLFWPCRQIDAFCPVDGKWNFIFMSACFSFFFPVTLCNLLVLVCIFFAIFAFASLLWSVDSTFLPLFYLFISEMVTLLWS